MIAEILSLGIDGVAVKHKCHVGSGLFPCVNSRVKKTDSCNGVGLDLTLYPKFRCKIIMIVY